MPWTGTTTRATGYLVTAAVWNAEHVDNMQFLEEVAYTEFTAPVSITATTDAGANTIVASSSVTYEAVPHMIEFYAPKAQTGASAAVVFTLWEDATDLGRLGELNSAAVFAPVKIERRRTPTAAAHVYTIKAYRVTANGTITAGAGGTGVFMPGFIRVTRIPT